MYIISHDHAYYACRVLLGFVIFFALFIISNYIIYSSFGLINAYKIVFITSAVYSKGKLYY
jgi:hypothetical protein